MKKHLARTRKRDLGLIVLYYLLLLMVCQTQFLHEANAAIRIVPSASYPTIQSAINAAKRGDTIQVASGIYTEHLIVPVVDLKIIGQNKITTIIDANEEGTPISLEADGVTITGFTIRNGGTRNNAITTYVFGGHNISGNIIENNADGISFKESGNNIISRNTFSNNRMRAINIGDSSTDQISGNNISDSAYGINLTSANSATVTGNKISNTSYGIYVYGSSQNVISGNTLQSTSCGIETAYSNQQTINNNVLNGGMYGILIHTTRDSQLNNNTVTEASYGIYLAHSSYNTLGGTRGNMAATNDWGIFLANSTSNLIINGNVIGENTWGMYLVSGSSGNTIHHNNFVGNVVQALQGLGCSNTWDNGVEGNYWNDYPGYPPASGVDYHPLSAPWPLRNIATTIVTVSTTLAYPGDIITISATVRNFGAITETFMVTAYFNSTLIGTQITTLTPSSTAVLTYYWNTTDVLPSHCVVSVTAGPILYVERDYNDNSLNQGPVAITFLGDCDVDGDVDYDDFVVLAAAYGSTSGQPAYNSTADFDHDDDVDYNDFVVLAADYGKHV